MELFVFSMIGVSKIVTIYKNAKYNEDILKWRDAVEIYYCIDLTSSNTHDYKKSL